MFLEAAVDEELVFDDGVVGAGAGYTSVGDNIAQKGGADGEIDVGRYEGAATQNKDRFPSISVNVNVISVDLTTTDETYFARIDWAPTSSFAAISNASPNFALVPGQNFNTTKVLDRFARLVYVLAGTTPILKVEQGFLSFQTQ